MHKKSSYQLFFDPSNLTTSELEQVLYNIEHPVAGGIVETQPEKADRVRSLISGLLAAKLT